MSSLQRPAKRLRSSPGSKPTLFQSNSTVPILLRHQDPDIAVIKCLEAISTERLLRQCDLIDKVIAENFWDKTEPQNRNRTNVREAKVYICRLIGPILYQLITQYIDSLEHADLESPLPPSPPAVQHNAPHPQHSGPVGTADGASAGLEEAFRAVPPALPAAPAVPAALSHAAPIGVGTWLATNNAFPFRQNLEIIQQSSTLQRLNPAPAQEFYNVQELRFPEAVHGQTVTEPSNQENAPASNASPAQARTTVQPEPSVSELTNAITDRQETRSVVSVVRNKHRSGTYTPCSFCSKPLPSPSARREHEQVHIYQLCNYKRFQCKHSGCTYRSHRPREVAHHMENRHNWKRQGRKFSKEDFIDHGPLPEERMRRLRQEYTSRGSTTRGSVTGFSASEMGRPSDSGQMDTDDLEYSLSQTQLQSQLPQAIPSSMFAIDSHFDETNSLIMRDNIDQSSQLDYDMNELLAFRNSIGNFQQAYPPQGPQLVGVGAHARSMLRDIPPTLDVEEDGQGENDVEWSNDPEWSENQVVNTMKGS